MGRVVKIFPPLSDVYYSTHTVQNCKDANTLNNSFFLSSEYICRDANRWVKKLYAPLSSKINLQFSL